MVTLNAVKLTVGIKHHDVHTRKHGVEKKSVSEKLSFWLFPSLDPSGDAADICRSAGCEYFKNPFPLLKNSRWHHPMPRVLCLFCLPASFMERMARPTPSCQALCCRDSIHHSISRWLCELCFQNQHCNNPRLLVRRGSFEK